MIPITSFRSRFTRAVTSSSLRFTYPGKQAPPIMLRRSTLPCGARFENMLESHNVPKVLRPSCFGIR